MALLQLFHEVEVARRILVHAGEKGFLRFGDGLDLRRDDITKVVQPDIALALHTERCDAVAGDLGQQGAADALDAKGEAGMFYGAGVAKVAEHGQEAGRLLLGQAVQQVGDVGVGIAELRRRGHHLFRLRRMRDQSDCHHLSFLRYFCQRRKVRHGLLHAKLLIIDFKNLITCYRFNFNHFASAKYFVFHDISLFIFLFI